MSVKLPNRLSSKKKKPAQDNVQTEVLQRLGLEAYGTALLDPASMLDISTWNLENQAPLEPKDLPKAFLQRLWLLSPDARSTRCKPRNEGLNTANDAPLEMMNGFGEESHYAINPLDLVTAVFMSSNTFLHQEMMVHMMQCQFAVPLVLPSIDTEEPSRFLLWPMRSIVSQWKSHSLEKTRRVQEGDLASTYMPLISCVKIGHCGVSKSQVLNHVMSGLESCNETFLHKGMDGGKLHRKLSNGLVEIGWCLPTGNPARDNFPVPVVIANLRGDASTHEKCFSLLCQASSAVIVFCGTLREKDKQLIAYCKDAAKKFILIDLLDAEKNENSVVGFVGQSVEEAIGLPEGSALQGNDLSEEELANRLSDTLKELLPDKLTFVTLEEAANLAAHLGLTVDEGAVCKKAMATVEEVLKGLEEGSSHFKEKQLPLQGHLWRRLAEIEKEESKPKKGNQSDPEKQKEKKVILVELSSYKMTPAMKIFTDALFTRDKIERTYFLCCMKQMLRKKQTEKQEGQQDLFTNAQKETKDDAPECTNGLENGADDGLEDSDSFCTDSSFEEDETGEQLLSLQLQVRDQQLNTEQGLDNVILKPPYEGIEPQTEKKNLEPRPNPTIEQKLSMSSSEKETQDEDREITENEVSVEEQLSNPVYENQNCNLESGERLTLSSQGVPQDEPQLMLETSDFTSSQQQMCPESSFNPQVAWRSELFQPNPSFLGLEHFLREVGLIFEFTHISPGSGSHNILRLPSLAADMLLYGVPLELMDGDATNIPIHWLGCVFAELKRRLPQEKCRTRVLTNLGVHHARNAEVLSALFGVKFPEGRQRSIKGVYMLALCLPDGLSEAMQCNFLLLVDVEGLCSMSYDNDGKTQIHDNEMSTVATGLGDVLIQNISSHSSSEFETDLTVIVNALLRIKECGSMPNSQLLLHNEGINGLLQATQLRRVSDMLQTETGDRAKSIDEQHQTSSCITFIKGPWSNNTLCEPVDTQYGQAVLKLKKNLFGALRQCAAKSDATGLPEIMIRLCAVWDKVKAESFSVSLQNKDIALGFSLLCTELSQWKDTFLEHMDSWLLGATQKIVTTNALDAAKQNDLLSQLKDEAGEEVKSEVGKLKAKVEAYLMKDDALKVSTETFKPILMSNINHLQEQVSEEVIQRLETIKESHCSSTQLRRFEALLAQEQESLIQTLVENSKSDKVILQDAELEEEFESMWSKMLMDFDFRPSERDDISARVMDILKKNLISRDLRKHMKKVEVNSNDQTSTFQVYDEHFGYRTRLKHMFEDNNRIQRLEAQRLASQVIEEYHQWVADKCSLAADFSDSYIVELLENVEKALSKKSMEIRSAFEVDLKVYLCGSACQDFQRLHDHYAKDSELLTCIAASKSRYKAEFIYQFRKRDQCQRMAQAFTSMVIKPTVIDYIYRPLGTYIIEEIQVKEQQYKSQHSFNQNLLEELIKNDSSESFLEYLVSYDSFRLKRIQETVFAHLSGSTNVNTWRQHRLGEIVGKIATAVSETAEGTNGVLSDTKPLLERVCLTLEKSGEMDITRACLDGPLFSITTEWDRFVTCLMALLAEMRLDFAQEFSQNVDAAHLLECLPVQPIHLLFNKVKGCDKLCPLCGAPCEVEEIGHEVHSSLLHRPKGILPCDSALSFSESNLNTAQKEDTQNIFMACIDFHSLHPDWNLPVEHPCSQMPATYWRYVFARFNEKFAKENDNTPATIPEEWKKITEEAALSSLKEAFLT
ncbi:interferon-induced very large GTPase 1 [Echeneis naucrates]|uniref:interferon-induced very large GTPase 1 n=1 Tax=Echeneis naucrates TaxID=173247 RepID=UPI0011140750|nr:interferon-induced very large GTPase 1-like [Echeneis naucrates]